MLTIQLKPPYRQVQPEYLPYAQKSPEWFAIRGEVRQTGSRISAYVGLSPPYKGCTNTPQFRYRADTDTLQDGETDVVTENEHMAYGSRYEDRGRIILNHIFAPLYSKEYGFFRDTERRNMGMSPDGLTNAVKVMVQLECQLSLAQFKRLSLEEKKKYEPFVIEMGQTAVEHKSSKGGLKPNPQIAHMTQLMEQMWIMGYHYGFLFYWHNDQVRVWMMPFNAPFFNWVLRRLVLFDWHKDNNVPITDDNPYFRWKRNLDKGDNAWYNSLSDFLDSYWFAPDDFKYKPRRPLGEYIDPASSWWPYTLRDSPFAPDPSIPSGQDALQFQVPPKPDIYLVYECLQPPLGRPPDEKPLYPKDLPESHPYFSKFETVDKWAVRMQKEEPMRNGDFFPSRGNNIPIMYIHQLALMKKVPDTRPDESVQSLHTHAKEEKGDKSSMSLDLPRPSSRKTLVTEFRRKKRGKSPGFTTTRKMLIFEEKQVRSPVQYDMSEPSPPRSPVLGEYDQEEQPSGFVDDIHVV